MTTNIADSVNDLRSTFLADAPSAYYRFDENPFMGIMEFEGQDDSAANASKSWLVGATLGYTWAQLEPSEGVYNWSLIDADIAPWSAQGKVVQVRVATAFKGNSTTNAHFQGTWKQATPQWVFDAGAQSVTGTSGCVYPIYWDSIYVTKYLTFIAAFGARFDSNPAIAFVMPGVGCYGETFLDTNDIGLANWQPLGYTNAIWENYIFTITQAHKAAFVRTPLSMSINTSYLQPDGTHGYSTILQAALKYLSWPQDDGLNAVSDYTAHPDYFAGPHIVEQKARTGGSGDTIVQDLQKSIDLGARYSLIYSQDVAIASYATSFQQYAALVSSPTAKDASGNGKTLSLIGKVSPLLRTSVNDYQNGAFLFDGISGYATQSSAAQTNASVWSLKASIYPTILPQTNAIVVLNGAEAAGGYGFGIGAAGGGTGSKLLGYLPGVGWIDSGYTFSAINQWYSVFMTCDGTTLKFYVNGVQTTLTSTSMPLAVPSRFTIGASYGSGGAQKYYTGMIDEVLVYPTTLSASRIATLSTAEIPLETMTGVTTGNTTPAAPTYSAFVIRSGVNLMYQGNIFRSTGSNIYWAALADNPSVSYPSNFQVLDALKTAKEMGANTLRCHTLGISIGSNFSSLTLFPTLASLTNNTPTAAMFERMDYFIYQASLLGLKLVVPLTDDHQYYHGGLYDFLGWRGYTVSGTNPDATPFYTDATVLADFKRYIQLLLTHVNQYSSVAYKDDPTILCWETGNELQTVLPPSTWTGAIATHIKTTIGASQLIMDGSGGSGTGSATTASLALTNVDLYTEHFYPQNIYNLQTIAKQISGAGKAFIVGEYDWTYNQGGTATMTLDTTTVPTGGGTQSLAIVVAKATADPSFEQLQQPGLTLTNGHTYTFSFWAKSTGAVYTSNNPLNIGLQQNYGGYNVYKETAFATSTTWTQYSFTYTHSSATDNNVFLYMNFGYVATTTNIDLVSFTDNAVPGTNLISNPSFESSTTAITPWVNNELYIDSLLSFVQAIEAGTTVSGGVIAGDLFWDIYSHANTYGYVYDSDKYTLYYPGTTSDMRSRSATLRDHIYRMRGITPSPSSSIPAAPTITIGNASSTGTTLAWQGVVGGATYAVERSVSGGAFVVVSSILTDAALPYQDTGNTTSGTTYRVRAYNRDGVAGPYSATYSATGTSVGLLVATPTVLNDNRLSERITLTNTGSTSLTWSGSCQLTGVTFSPASGTLTAGATQVVTVTLPANTTTSTSFVFIGSNNTVNVPWNYTVTLAVAAFYDGLAELFLDGLPGTTRDGERT